MTIQEKAKKIASLLDDKKALDIKTLEISKVSTLADYFVICTCTSTTQLRACVDEVEEKMKELGFIPAHIEGYRSGTWILMDYHDVVVHIFMEEARNFYDVERLWADAEEIISESRDAD
ncbi:MAG: ribosome silencing factor [Oscillospiraceae bacterium]|nr:ribosome silencing factor [Oscillospiraceae bacterium]